MKNTLLQGAAAVFSVALLASGVSAATNVSNDFRQASGSGLVGAVARAKPSAVAILNSNADENSNHPDRINTSIRGSGVHFKTGYILTAYHVTAARYAGRETVMKEISILTDRKEQLSATLAGASPFLDIAIYKIDDTEAAESLAVSPFAAAPSLPGEEIFAVGYPLGRGPMIAYSHIGNTQIYLPEIKSRLIQVDMQECSGNSGGGIFNNRGEIVGMTHAVIPDDAQQPQCGKTSFIVPGSLIARVADALIKGEQPKFSKLGISMTPVKLKNAWRVAVGESTGPAKDAGIRKDDIILEIDGTAVDTADELASYVAEQTVPGQKSAIRVLRGKEDKLFTVTMGSH